MKKTWSQMTPQERRKDLREWMRAHGVKIVSHTHDNKVYLFDTNSESCPKCGQKEGR